MAGVENVTSGPVTSPPAAVVTAPAPIVSTAVVVRPAGVVPVLRTVTVARYSAPGATRSGAETVAARFVGAVESSGVQRNVPARRAWPSVFASSDQNTGLRPATQADCGAIAKPSSLTSGRPVGRS